MTSDDTPQFGQTQRKQDRSCTAARNSGFLSTLRFVNTLRALFWPQWGHSVISLGTFVRLLLLITCIIPRFALDLQSPSCANCRKTLFSAYQRKSVLCERRMLSVCRQQRKKSGKKRQLRPRTATNGKNQPQAANACGCYASAVTGAQR